MSSLVSINDDDESNAVGLHFVIPKGLTKDECSEDMREAFQMSLKSCLSPEWEKEENCLQLSPTKRNVFVFQQFKGPAFRHLHSFKCVSLVGPRCLLSCLINEEVLPLVSYPTFTAAMRDLVITCSGGGADVKREIKEKVEQMAGVFSKNFTEKITHVVVSSAASSKYEKALEFGIPVMTRHWVEAVWKESQQNNVIATDKKYDIYKCPTFLELHICSSGLTIRDTERLKTTIIKNGGIYHPSLIQSVNILVVKNPKKDKFKYAQAWSIPCVQQQWVYDSVQNGHALPTKTYEIVTRGASSPSREGDPAVTFADSDVSAIQFDQRTHIDETLMDTTSASVASFCPVVSKAMPPPTTPVKKAISVPGPTPKELKYLLKELDLGQTMKAGSFLDGCGVFLYGWETDEEEKLRRILKCSGAARFTDLSDRVSHVLVGNLDKPFLRTLKDLSHRPHVLNIKWLIQSVADKAPASEEPFSCLPIDTTSTTEAPSPLSKKGMALLQRGNNSPAKPASPPPAKEPTISPNKGQQLLAKYMSSDSPALVKTSSPSSSVMPPPPVPSYSRRSLCNMEATSSDFQASETQSETASMIFSGYTFVIVGLADDAAEYVETDLIRKHGGDVVPKSYTGVPDFAVVPLTGAPLHQTVTGIVTSLWLEDCTAERSIVPVLYYHQPVALNLNKKPLNGCVLGTSGYSGSERQFIVELGSALGAVVQDCFAKISKIDKQASTHLICLTSQDSPKYDAAVRWFRPAVSHTWLLECASSGTRVPEKPHLLNKNQIIKPIESLDCSTASDRLETPPHIAALKKLPYFRTPEQRPPGHDKEKIDRFLNYVPSPNKYEVHTPPVPVGLSEEPTPGESKRFTKYIERLPEKRPPSPKRRDSTPLHVLRKQILQAMAPSTPEMLGYVPLSEGVDEEDIPESANAMLMQSKGTAGSPACSTPTLSDTTPTHVSRKLLDFAEKEVGSPIDGPLDKLKKLIETPEVPVEKSYQSSKSSRQKQNQVVENHETQLLSDSLKDASQPYAIKWEDPVNMVRNSKEGYASPLKPNNCNVAELITSAKRKSSESAESEPEIKKCHSEATQEAPKNFNSKKSYIFFLSCSGDREPYLKIISKLGGELIDTPTFNPAATHLVLEKAPQRSEKLLGCIASGKWVVHASYLIESEKKGKFLEEEDFEWGNPKNGRLLKLLKPGSVEESIAKAAYRWRMTISTTTVAGAFEGFKCKIFTTDDKVVAFQRLICAGGGTVLPENSEEKPSFCLVNLNVCAKKINLSEYAKMGVPCVPLTFIYEHLTIIPRPAPELRAVDEYKKLRKQFLAQQQRQ